MELLHFGDGISSGGADPSIRRIINLPIVSINIAIVVVFVHIITTIVVVQIFTKFGRIPENHSFVFVVIVVVMQQ